MCMDINACTRDPCYPGTECQDLPPPSGLEGFQCGSCPSGYAGDGITCEEINECLTNNGGCDETVFCYNDFGSFECAPCSTRKRGSGQITAEHPQGCRDITTCNVNNGGCDPKASCTNTSNALLSFCGFCPKGYEGTGYSNCVDIDGCKDSPCYPGVVCADIPAELDTTEDGNGYTCGPCPLGTTGDGDACMEVDACMDAPCFPGAVCTDVPSAALATYNWATFLCGDCPAGYFGDGISCTALDGCTARPCHPGVQCFSGAMGAFSCGACPPGFVGDGETCVDVDECLASPCDSRVECTNFNGSFACGSCSTIPDAGLRGPGVLLDGATQCRTPTACAVDNGGCDSASRCFDINPNDPSLGSYCGGCPNGYTGTGEKGCVVIDACAEDPCFPDVQCTNLPPGEGRVCSPCPPGYLGNGEECEACKFLVDIVGSDAVFNSAAPRSRAIRLFARVQEQTQGCLGTLGFGTSWVITSRDFPGVRFDLTAEENLANTLSLYLPPRLLPSGAFYTARVQVCLGLGVCQSSEYSFNVLPGDLVPIIAGGDRTVPVDQLFSLDASRSFDPDAGPEDAPMEFFWKCGLCTDLSGGSYDPACAGACLDSAGAAPRFIANSKAIELRLGGNNAEYRFTLTLSQGGRLATVQRNILITPGQAPQADIVPLASSILNPGEKVTLQGQVSGSARPDLIQARWEVRDIQGVPDQLDLLDRRAVASEPQDDALVLRPGALRPGGRYTFAFQAVDPNGASAASITLSVNAPPYGGSATVFPLQGEAFYTRFALDTAAVGVATVWTDPEAHYPLSYRFTYTVMGTGEELTLSEWSPIMPPPAALPAGLEAYGWRIVIKAYARDALGAVSVDPVQRMVQVRWPATVDDGAIRSLFDAQDALLHEDVLRGNLDGAMQQANALVALLNAPPSTGREGWGDHSDYDQETFGDALEEVGGRRLLQGDESPLFRGSGSAVDLVSRQEMRSVILGRVSSLSRMQIATEESLFRRAQVLRDLTSVQPEMTRDFHMAAAEEAAAIMATPLAPVATPPPGTPPRPLPQATARALLQVLGALGNATVDPTPGLLDAPLNETLLYDDAAAVSSLRTRTMATLDALVSAFMRGQSVGEDPALFSSKAIGVRVQRDSAERASSFYYTQIKAPGSTTSFFLTPAALAMAAYPEASDIELRLVSTSFDFHASPREVLDTWLVRDNVTVSGGVSSMSLTYAGSSATAGGKVPVAGLIQPLVFTLPLPTGGATVCSGGDAEGAGHASAQCSFWGGSNYSADGCFTLPNPVPPDAAVNFVPEFELPPPAARRPSDYSRAWTMRSKLLEGCRVGYDLYGWKQYLNIPGEGATCEILKPDNMFRCYWNVTQQVFKGPGCECRADVECMCSHLADFVVTRAPVEVKVEEYIDILINPVDLEDKTYEPVALALGLLVFGLFWAFGHWFFRTQKRKAIYRDLKADPKYGFRAVAEGPAGEFLSWLFHADLEPPKGMSDPVALHIRGPGPAITTRLGVPYHRLRTALPMDDVHLTNVRGAGGGETDDERALAVEILRTKHMLAASSLREMDSLRHLMSSTLTQGRIDPRSAIASLREVREKEMKLMVPRKFEPWTSDAADTSPTKKAPSMFSLSPRQKSPRPTPRTRQMVLWQPGKDVEKIQVEKADVERVHQEVSAAYERKVATYSAGSSGAVSEDVEMGMGARPAVAAGGAEVWVLDRAGVGGEQGPGPVMENTLPPGSGTSGKGPPGSGTSGYGRSVPGSGTSSNAKGKQVAFATGKRPGAGSTAAAAAALMAQARGVGAANRPLVNFKTVLRAEANVVEEEARVFPNPEEEMDRKMGTALVYAYLASKGILSPGEVNDMAATANGAFPVRVVGDMSLMDHVDMFKVMAYADAARPSGWYTRARLWHLVFSQNMDGTWTPSEPVAFALQAKDSKSPEQGNPSVCDVEAIAASAPDFLIDAVYPPPHIDEPPACSPDVAETLWTTLLCLAFAEDRGWDWVVSWGDRKRDKPVTVVWRAHEWLRATCKEGMMADLLEPLRLEALRQVRQWETWQVEALAAMQKQVKIDKLLHLRLEQGAFYSAHMRRARSWRQYLQTHRVLKIFMCPATDTFTASERALLYTCLMLGALAMCVWGHARRAEECCRSASRFIGCAGRLPGEEVAECIVGGGYKIIRRHATCATLVEDAALASGGWECGTFPDGGYMDFLWSTLLIAALLIPLEILFERIYIFARYAQVPKRWKQPTGLAAISMNRRRRRFKELTGPAASVAFMMSTWEEPDVAAAPEETRERLAARLGTTAMYMRRNRASVVGDARPGVQGKNPFHPRVEAPSPALGGGGPAPALGGGGASTSAAGGGGVPALEGVQPGGPGASTGAGGGGALSPGEEGAASVFPYPALSVAPAHIMSPGRPGPVSESRHSSGAGTSASGAAGRAPPLEAWVGSPEPARGSPAGLWEGAEGAARRGAGPVCEATDAAGFLLGSRTPTPVKGDPLTEAARGAGPRRKSHNIAHALTSVASNSAALTAVAAASTLAKPKRRIGRYASVLHKNIQEVNVNLTLPKTMSDRGLERAANNQKGAQNRRCVCFSRACTCGAPGGRCLCNSKTCVCGSWEAGEGLGQWREMGDPWSEQRKGKQQYMIPWPQHPEYDRDYGTTEDQVADLYHAQQGFLAPPWAVPAEARAEIASVLRAKEEKHRRLALMLGPPQKKVHPETVRKERKKLNRARWRVAGRMAGATAKITHTTRMKRAAIKAAGQVQNAVAGALWQSTSADARNFMLAKQVAAALLVCAMAFFLFCVLQLAPRLFKYVGPSYDDDWLVQFAVWLAADLLVLGWLAALRKATITFLFGGVIERMRLLWDPFLWYESYDDDISENIVPVSFGRPLDQHWGWDRM